MSNIQKDFVEIPYNFERTSKNIPQVARRPFVSFIQDKYSEGLRNLPLTGLIHAIVIRNYYPVWTNIIQLKEQPRTLII